MLNSNMVYEFSSGELGSATDTYKKKVSQFKKKIIK